MSGGIEETRALLARHHRDGRRFAELMKAHFAQRYDEAFWAEWARWMEPVLSDPPTVLDLGSGPGLFLRALVERYPGARAIGVECAPYMLDAAGELPGGCEMAREDLHDPHLPLADGSVDAALASVVLHEMNQPVRALQETARCLRRGGRLMVLEWVRVPLRRYLEEEGHLPAAFDPATPAAELADIFVHFVEHNRYTVEDLEYLLQRTGFAVLERVLLRGGRFVRLVAERR
ncbi:class I SAM-dependent methyltransferase [Inmirania thermothiophila]|uniref:Methyltransferase family protein n=1 Tax=Inmirania thermothiophila TaxID=1750597 RepID=A0A3N1YA67_9GAMM|nr:class I SAM-dependent methyltransferase [Inmirania thermothiophila]ROR34522.1 methyltransferase family protein [Inmirania thermothiophila]